MSKDSEGLAGCGCHLLVVLFNLTLGGYSFQYVLKAFIGKDVAWYWDFIGGLFLGEVTVPLAVIAWVVNHIGGVPVPFSH